MVFTVRGGPLLAHNTVCLKWVSRFQTDTSLFPCTADMIHDCSVGWHIRRRIRVPAAHKQTTIYLYIILFSIHSGWFMSCGHYCGENLLGLCDQKSSYKYGPYTQCLWCYGCFLILINALLRTECHTSWSLLYAMWLWTTAALATERQVMSAYFTTEQQGVFGPSMGLSKTHFKHK